jgi:hypothetical protein
MNYRCIGARYTTTRAVAVAIVGPCIAWLLRERLQQVIGGLQFSECDMRCTARHSLECSVLSCLSGAISQRTIKNLQHPNCQLSLSKLFTYRSDAVTADFILSSQEHLRRRHTEALSDTLGLERLHLSNRETLSSARVPMEAAPPPPEVLCLLSESHG